MKNFAKRMAALGNVAALLGVLALFTAPVFAVNSYTSCNDEVSSACYRVGPVVVTACMPSGSNLWVIKANCTVFQRSTDGYQVLDEGTGVTPVSQGCERLYDSC